MIEIRPAGFSQTGDHHAFATVADQLLQAVVADRLDGMGTVGGGGANLLDALLGCGNSLLDLSGSQ